MKDFIITCNGNLIITCEKMSVMPNYFFITLSLLCTYQLLIYLAHLSRRLIGELIVYQWSGVRRPSVRRPSSTMLKHLLLRNRLVDQSQILCGASLGICLRHLGHMTKMAATPIYGQNPSKIFFSRTGGPIFTKLGM